jgi:hypothetical protein
MQGNVAKERNLHCSEKLKTQPNQEIGIVTALTLQRLWAGRFI